eukprot:scaffold3862_cov201-Alexandrium_tamarense.AAC.10
MIRLFTSANRRGKWDAASNAYVSKDEETINRCFEMFRPSVLRNTTDSEILNYCVNVCERRKVFPDHDIQACKYTGKLEVGTCRDLSSLRRANGHRRLCRYDWSNAAIA